MQDHKGIEKTAVVQRKTGKILGTTTGMFIGKYCVRLYWYQSYRAERTLTSMKYRYGMLEKGKLYLIAHGKRDASMLPGFEPETLYNMYLGNYGRKEIFSTKPLLWKTLKTKN